MESKNIDQQKTEVVNYLENSTSPKHVTHFLDIW